MSRLLWLRNSLILRRGLRRRSGLFPVVDLLRFLLCRGFLIGFFLFIVRICLKLVQIIPFRCLNIIIDFLSIPLRLITVLIVYSCLIVLFLLC